MSANTGKTRTSTCWEKALKPLASRSLTGPITVLNQLQQVDRYTVDSQLVRSLYRYDPLGRRLVKQVEHYSIKDNQLHEAADTEVEFYGWDGDRLAFTQTEENQWHIIYEPESFTPLLQLQHATDAPISEQDKMLAEVMGSLQSTLNYLPAHEAYELARTLRERTIAQLKANEQWQTPELPEECYFYHCNHLGLPEALTDTNGEAVWAASYDAWGTSKQSTTPTIFINRYVYPVNITTQKRAYTTTVIVITIPSLVITSIRIRLDWPVVSRT